MINEKEQIIIIAEEQYSKTTWYSMIIDGIKKETHKRAIEVLVVPENHIQTLPVGTIIVLLGSSVSFISSCINKCYNSKLRPIVAGFEIYPNNAHISYVTINRRYAMSENIKHLISAGANHIALFGINSSIQTDMLRLKGWQDIAMTYDIGKEEKDEGEFAAALRLLNRVVNNLKNNANLNHCFVYGGNAVEAILYLMFIVSNLFQLFKTRRLKNHVSNQIELVRLLVKGFYTIKPSKEIIFNFT